MSGKFIVSDFSKNNSQEFNSFSDAYAYWMNDSRAFFFDAIGFKDENLLAESICDTSGMQDYIAKNNLLLNIHRYPDTEEVWNKIADEEIAARKLIGKPQPVDNNRKTTVALNKPKVSDVPPIALFALGGAMSDGAQKYGRFNWRDTAVTASVFYDAIHRHMAAWYNGEDFAPDSNMHHLAHVMASCAILLDAPLHDVFVDDRDKRRPTPVDKKEWSNLEGNNE